MRSSHQINSKRYRPVISNYNSEFGLWGVYSRLWVTKLSYLMMVLHALMLPAIFRFRWHPLLRVLRPSQSVNPTSGSTGYASSNPSQLFGQPSDVAGAVLAKSTGSPLNLDVYLSKLFFTRSFQTLFSSFFTRSFQTLFHAVPLLREFTPYSASARPL